MRQLQVSAQLNCHPRVGYFLVFWQDDESDCVPRASRYHA